VPRSWSVCPSIVIAASGVSVASKIGANSINMFPNNMIIHSLAANPD